MIELLAVIDAPHYHAALVLWERPDGEYEVVEAAPIIAWMAKQHWTRQQVRSYVGKKGHRWSVSVVHQIERECPEWWKNRPTTTRRGK